MGKVIPIILIVVGLVAGVGAGIFLRPSMDSNPACEVVTDGHGVETEVCSEVEHTSVAEIEHGEEADASSVNYVKLSNQFVVPVVEDGVVAALVVMSLSIETIPSMMETVYKVEPKLRDAFLQVMFLHANSGGFSGQFTSGQPMKDLRGSLLEAAQEILGTMVTAVLVTDILRQDT